MAHVQKNTKAACGNLFEHYGRALDNTKAIEQRKYNKNIDVTRTHLNYNLGPHHLEKIQDQTELLRKRLSEVKCQKRADVNVMCSWVVTIPKDLLTLHPEKQADFFKETYNFLENRYGKENVISSWVHLDETTPHMHFAFVPVTHDQKKDIDKVSAKIVLNRTELSSFHKDLQKCLEQKLGCEVPILNGATINGNRSIEEMKLEKLQKATNFYQRQKERREKEFNEVSVEVRQLKDERVHVNARIEEEQDLLKDIKEVQIPKAQDELKNINEVLIPDAQDQLKDINEVQLPDARRELISAQISVKEAQDELTALQKEKELLQGDITELKDNITELSKEVSQWQNSLDVLKDKVVSILNSASETFKKIIKLNTQLPEEKAIEFVEKNRLLHNEKIDQLEAHPQIKEKSKGIIDAAAEEVKEYIRPRRRGR